MTAAQGPAAAQRLFDEARAALLAGDVEGACAKLEASERLDPQLGTLLHLAYCNERRGKLASAYQQFERAAELAEARIAAGTPERRADVARARAASLEPRLSRVSLSLPASMPPELQVFHDAARWPRERWVTGLPVDPGEHVVEVKAADALVWRTSYQVTRARQQVHVRVPELQVGAEPAAAASGPPPASGATPSEQPSHHERPELAPPAVAKAAASHAARRDEGPRSHPTRRVLGYAVAGAGVVAAALATGFLIAAANAYADEKRLLTVCERDVSACDDATRAAFRAAEERNKSEALVGFVSAGVAVSALAGSLALLLTARDDVPPSSQGRANLPVNIVIAPRSARLTFSVRGP